MNKYLIVYLIITTFVNFEYEVNALQIVNGTTAEEDEFPYMVQLRDDLGFFMCGGAILGPEWILTAGHCIENREILSIVYGTNRLYDVWEGYPNTSIYVKNWFQHPNFTRTSAGLPIYDVGILQLEEPIPLSESAQPITLPDADGQVPFHVQGVLSGWGVNDTLGPLQRYLRKVHLQLLTDEECTQKINDYTGKDTFSFTHNLCSDDHWNGACTGDSGSPLVIDEIAYGLVSWSYKPCGVIPGTYSRITNPEYRNWIRNITNI